MRKDTRNALVMTLLCAAICSVNWAPALAQTSEPTVDDHPPVLDLFNSFNNVARKADARGELVLAAGMYKESLEHAIRYGATDRRYVDTLCRLANVYNRMGYGWRAKPLLEKAMASVSAHHSLYNQTVEEALKGYAGLMRKAKKDKEAETYERLAEKLSYGASDIKQ
ncbi:MAG: hypothetical protein IPM23_08655 [Candidatus Melainabacteria bacterium]|nr:hypothetical protein [Candidatus Melainabacteria bacterium]